MNIYQFVLPFFSSKSRFVFILVLGSITTYGQSFGVPSDPGDYPTRHRFEPIIGFEKGHPNGIDYLVDYFIDGNYQPIGDRYFKTIGKADIFIGDSTKIKWAQVLLDSLERNQIQTLLSNTTLKNKEDLNQVALELYETALWPLDAQPTLMYKSNQAGKSTFRRNYYGYFDNFIHPFFQVEIIFDQNSIEIKLLSGENLVDDNLLIIEQFKFERGLIKTFDEFKFKPKIFPIKNWKNRLKNEKGIPFDEKKILIESLLWAKPADNEHYSDLVFLYLSNNMFDEAIMTANIFLDSKVGRKTIILYIRGLAYYYQKEYKLALQDLEYAYKYFEIGQEELAHTQLKLMDFNGVISLLKHENSNIESLIYLYEAYKKLGNEIEAQKTIDICIALIEKGTNPEKKYSEYLRIKNYPKSLENLKKVLVLEPQNISNQMNLLEILMLNNKFTEAKQLSKSLLVNRTLKPYQRYITMVLAKDAAICTSDQVNTKKLESQIDEYVKASKIDIICKSCWNFDYYREWLSNNKTLNVSVKSKIMSNIENAQKTINSIE